MSQIHVISHPLVQHKLTQMRRVDTPSERFRQLLTETSLLLTYEVTRDLPLVSSKITTPLIDMDAPELVDHPVVISILRAGNGLLDGVLQVIPGARVGHVGLYRDHDTLEAVEYYCKFPPLENQTVIVVDPMLATGNSADKAITMLKEAGAKNIIFACLLSVPEGIDLINQKHPDVPIYTCCLDEGLNELGYIVPGLGDAGDRLYGTI